MTADLPLAAPLLSPEAVAYIGGGAKRSVSPRVICLDAFPEALRTAHLRRCSGRGARGWTYATAKRGTRRLRGDALCSRRGRGTSASSRPLETRASQRAAVLQSVSRGGPLGQRARWPLGVRARVYSGLLRGGASL